MNRTLKARYGTKQYCHSFLNRRPCRSSGCSALHEWIPTTTNILHIIDTNSRFFTAYNAKPCGLTSIEIPEHPHARLKLNELRVKDVMDKRVCMVNGLPLNITKATLLHENWYGRFGHIYDITTRQCTLTTKAWIYYRTCESAEKAIEMSNNATFNDGRVLKAMYGANNYCEAFQRKQICTNTKCRYLHKYGKDWRNTKDYRSKEYGLPSTVDEFSFLSFCHFV